jgi:hypothetical protein
VAKLVYIAGLWPQRLYLLTAQPKVVACGEVERHTRRFAERKTCTCGRPMQERPVWGSFEHDTGKLKGWSPSNSRLRCSIISPTTTR